MKEPADLESTQIVLFAVGQLPHKHVMTRDGLAQIKDQFSFKTVSTLTLTSDLVFEGGVVEEPKGKRSTITRLQIGDRRMILTVAADTKTTSKVLETLKRTIAKLDPASAFEKAKPITHRHETTCSVTLDFDWKSLFNPALAAFLETAATKAASDSDATASVAHATCRVTLTYAVKAEQITQSGISFSPKEFVVEPLVNTPLSARRYFTASPTDSMTHLDLIRELEASLTARLAATSKAKR